MRSLKKQGQLTSLKVDMMTNWTGAMVPEQEVIIKVDKLTSTRWHQNMRSSNKTRSTDKLTRRQVDTLRRPSGVVPAGAARDYLSRPAANQTELLRMRTFSSSPSSSLPASTSWLWKRNTSIMKPFPVFHIQNTKTLFLYCCNCVCCRIHGERLEEISGWLKQAIYSKGNWKLEIQLEKENVAK